MRWTANTSCCAITCFATEHVTEHLKSDMIDHNESLKVFNVRWQESRIIDLSLPPSENDPSTSSRIPPSFQVSAGFNSCFEKLLPWIPSNEPTDGPCSSTVYIGISGGSSRLFGLAMSLSLHTRLVNLSKTGQRQHLSQPFPP